MLSLGREKFGWALGRLGAGADDRVAEAWGYVAKVALTLALSRGERGLEAVRRGLEDASWILGAALSLQKHKSHNSPAAPGCCGHGGPPMRPLLLGGKS